MIPDFKTYIGESAWGEMRKRSSGELIRKEDNINSLDTSDFADYLNDIYLFDSFSIRVREDMDNSIIIPLLRTKNGVMSGWPIYLIKDDKEIYFSNKSFEILCKRLHNRLENKLTLKKNYNDFTMVVPPDGEKVTNQFLIYVLDTIIDTMDESEEIILIKRKLGESAWGEMRKRSSGELIRKEDDVDHFDYEEFFVYLTEHYQPKSKKINEKIGGRTSVVDTDIIEIFIPIESVDGRIKTLIVEMDKKDNSIVSMRTSATLFDKYTNLERMLSKNYILYTIKGSYGIYIRSKEKPTNRTVIDLIDIFLAVIDDPVLEKIS